MQTSIDYKFLTLPAKIIKPDFLMMNVKGWSAMKWAVVGNCTGAASIANIANKKKTRYYDLDHSFDQIHIFVLKVTA